MALWMKTIVAVAMMLVPGAFVLFLAFTCARAVRARWLVAQQQSPGGAVPMKQVLAGLRLSDLVRDARAAF
jgi:hypothetical protein